MKLKMNRRIGEIFIAIAFITRGSSLLFSKIALRTMGPLLLLGTRFLIAFLVIGLLFRKELRKVTKKELLFSVVLGIFYVFSMVFELKGLNTCETSVAAFIEGTAVVVVPLLDSLVCRKWPEKSTIGTAVLAFFGVAFLTLNGGHIGMSMGELLVFIGAVWYSIAVIFTDYAVKNADEKVIAIYQLLFIGIFAMTAAFIFEEPRLPQSSTEWGAILALALICSGVGFTFQPLGQKYTTPERTSVLSMTNPLAATILGVIFLDEVITWNIVLGAILITVSILAPTLFKQYFDHMKGWR